MDQNRSEQLARLWTESQPVVAAFILSLAPNFHQAEDILQQVAVLLVREFEKYDQQRPFLPWVLGIARNVVLKERRQSAKCLERLMGDAIIAQVQAAFEQQDDSWRGVRMALRKCLQAQPRRVLELLRWRYAYDLKPGDAAVKMGLTAGAVRVMLHRARTVLRKCIKRNVEAAEWT